MEKTFFFFLFRSISAIGLLDHFIRLINQIISI